ncbi:putative ribonuclease H-like domain-containing protein [Tanacetum coccineum]
MDNTGIFGNAYDDVEEEVDMNNVDTSYTASDAPFTKFLKDHPQDQVIGSLKTPVQTRHMTKINEEHGLFSSVHKLRRTNHKDFQNCLFACFLSQMEPKKPVQALKDPSWVEAMQDELLQFKLLKVWTLVDLPRDKWAIGTKWVFRNKKDERGIVVKNKARLVAQGHTQEEGIDYDEVFAPVARIEAIRLFLAYASFKDFVVFQMDVKSAFLYGKIEEEVYVCQPPGFEDPHFPDKVYKVEKALYGLHQALRAWYETLSTYLLDNGFHRGQIDKILFIKIHKDDILLVHVYVDDIIFGSTKKGMSTKFEKLMHDKFQMSSMGVLSFFLGLQVQQKSDGIFISQDKYVAEILKKFDFASVKTASTPMETNKALIKDEESEGVDVHLYRSVIGSLMYLTSSRPDIMFAVCACAKFQVALKRIFRYLKGQPKLGLWYPKDSPFDLEAFSDSDYARASLDRKSTTGEYVAAANGCGQVLWIQNQMLDYGFNFMNTKIYVDHESTVCIVKNPVFHSKTKHIEIRHHFIRDSYEKKLIQVIKIHTDQNVADLLTKAFDASRVKTAKASQKEVGTLRYLSLVVPLKKVGDEAVHKELGDRMERAATTASSLEAEQDSGDRPAQTRLSERVIALENIKTGQDLEITNLKKRVKKLEKKKKSRTSQLKRRLFKVKIESSAKKSLGDQEDASKQGRNEIDQDEEISWFQDDAETQGSINITTVKPVITTNAPIATAGVSFSIAEPITPPITTTFIEDEDFIIAQTLMKIRSVKSKEKEYLVRLLQD